MVPCPVFGVCTGQGGKMGKIDEARFAAVSCTHCPYHNAAAIAALCRAIPAWDLTDFVLLGDLFESAAVSLHADADAHPHTLADEFVAAASVLEQIEAALPGGCRKTWMLGNHDDNLQVSDFRRSNPATRECLHWSYSPHAKTFAKWRQHPYTKPSVHDQSGAMLLGQVCFIHGYQAGATSDNIEAKRMRYALGGLPHLLVVRGHTHRPQPVTRCRDGNRPVHCWYANAGHLSSNVPPYMRRKDVNEWGSAVVVGSAKIGRTRRMARREWEARTILIEDLEDVSS